LLLSLLPFVIIKKSQEKKIILFTSTLIFSWIIVGIGNIPAVNSALYNVNIHQFIKGEKRYNDNLSNYPHNLKSFLDKYLLDNQTIYENINAHLLYALAGREAPFLHHSEQIFRSEKALDVYIRRFEKKYEEEDIPIIIMGGGNWWWGNAIDNIPAQLGTFNLTEWLYQHYAPWGTVDGYHLWFALNSRLWNEFSGNPYTLYADITDFDLGIENDLQSIDLKDDRVALLCGSYDPYVVIPLKTPMTLPHENSNVFLGITYKNNIEDSLQIFFNFGIGFNERSSSHYMIKDTKDDFITVYIPINGWNEDKSLHDIRIDPPNGSFFEFKDLRIVTSNLPRGAILNSSVSENYDFKLLPYVWANFDKKIKKQMPTVLFEFPTNLYLEDTIPVELPIKSNYIRNKGNYLYFMINSTEEKNRLTVVYGDPEKSQMTMDVLPGENKYLVRISTQYNWMKEAQKKLLVSADKSLIIKEMAILEGD
jgi:hypothetical protein